MCALFDLFKKKAAPSIPASAPGERAAKIGSIVKTGEAGTTTAPDDSGKIQIGAKPKRKGVPGLHI